ncbi:MAG: leucine-rich repeat protein [Bacteroidaceae bacterium]|nr:leucine-rich repeat protein [Bacteroidaceae bacterium]
MGCGLKHIEVPEGVTTIECRAFKGCGDLETVILPSTLTFIGDTVFVGCPKLTTMTCRAPKVPSIGHYYYYGLFGNNGSSSAKKDTLYVSKGCIEAYLNSQWKGYFNNILVEDDGTGEFLAGDVFTAKTEEGVEVRYSVMDAEAKTVAVGGYNLSAIGNFADMPEGYDYTISLPKEVNGYHVTAISDKAFQGKKYLWYINLPESLDSIGVEAFQGCEQLREIKFPSTLTKLGRRAFADCVNMSGVPVIPDGVKDIPDECFANCTSLWSPSLPHTLERIGRRAFWNIMGGHMFFPATLKSVGEEAYFGFMDGYATIQYRSAAMEPVEIPENAIAWMITPEQLQEFWMQDQAPGLYVPKGSLEAYKTTKGWSKFWPGIYELDNIDKCTVTYVLNGKEYQQVTVGYGREYEPDLIPAVPVGYEFSGWTWDTGATGALLVRQDHKVSGIFTTEEAQQMVKTLNLYGTDGEPCGTMDVNFLLTTDDNNHNSAIVYKPRAYVDLAEVMTDGIPAFSNVTGEVGVLALPDVIEDEAGVVYTVDSIGSCAFYGCGELLGIDFGNSVQAIGTQAFQRSALQGMVTIPTNVRRIGIQAFTNTKGVTKAVFQHRQPNEIGWGVGNKDDFAGPQQTVLEVCQGIIDECASVVRGDNFIYWYAENSQSLKNSYSDHIPNQLKLNGVAVTMANGSDILGNGTARYNAITRTLTLAGCEAEELQTTLIGGLTVMLVGDNQLQSVNAYKSALTVMSDEAAEGRLTVQGTVKLDRSDMTVKDCQRVEVNDEEYGLYTPWHNDLKARLTVDNSVLHVGKLRGFTDLHLVDVSLPQNAIFAAATGKGMHDSRAMTNLFQVWHNQVYELSSATIQYYEPPVQDEVGVTIQTDFAALFDGEETDKTPYNNEYNGVLYHLYREASEKDLDTWWWGGKSPVVNYYKDGALYLSTLMTDEQMKAIATADNLNTDEFLTYNGLVVHVSQGSGIITIDCATRSDHVLKVKVGVQEPMVIQTNGRQTIELPYRTDKDCYIYIYVANAYTAMEESHRRSAERRNIVDFPDETVAQLYGLSLTVESTSGVQTVTVNAADDTSRWYDLQGRPIEQPTKRGLYIHNGRKVMVK